MGSLPGPEASVNRLHRSAPGSSLSGDLLSYSRDIHVQETVIQKLCIEILVDSRECRINHTLVDRSERGPSSGRLVRYRRSRHSMIVGYGCGFWGRSRRFDTASRGEFGSSFQLLWIPFWLRCQLVNNRTKSRQLTGGTFIFMTFVVKFLSYRQFPSTLPKFRKARLVASVTASFFA